MRKRRADQRFQIVEPLARRSATPKREFAFEGPALVPLRVVASTPPLAPRLGIEDASIIEVALPDGIRLRFPRDVTAAFLVEVTAALRVSAC